MEFLAAMNMVLDADTAVARKILIGTSGWSYDDWIGRFYPQALASKKHKWLEYYGQYFVTTEVNSTFYSVPGERTVESWIRKGRRIQAEHPFEFTIKMHRDITHHALVEGARGDGRDRARAPARAAVLELADRFEQRVIQPLAEAGLLGAVLIQLSPYVRFDPAEPGPLLALFADLFELLRTDRYEYAVEFRHASWVGQPRDRLRKPAEELLSKHNVAAVATDGPGFPWTQHNDADHAYIRLHGHNRDIWFKHDREDAQARGDDRLNRYDYLYSPAELEQLAPRVRTVAKRTEKVRIYLNNHPFSKSIANAFGLMDLLGIEHKERELNPTRTGGRTQLSLMDF